jgi:hypothetical protein
MNKELPKSVPINVHIKNDPLMNKYTEHSLILSTRKANI